MRTERHLLQLAVAIACLVPLTVGTAGVLLGPAALGAPASTDLASHFRYLSGVFLGVGLGFASCVPRIESMGPRFRLLGLFVVVGGLARAFGLTEGTPSLGHRLGLAMELGIVPLLMVWQRRVARRYAG